MEIANLFIPATNRFATEYLAQANSIQPFFHYSYKTTTVYEERLRELMNRNFLREELVVHIERYMKHFPTSAKVSESLQKLLLEDSVVVIGGQQAGILTGPLYTIHKIISIIAFAKQKQQELKVPVIPVFWIAGEDHDYAEINHIYLEHQREMKKKTYPEKVMNKVMTSNLPLDRKVCRSWVESIVEDLGETEHTNKLLDFMNEAIDQSNTYVDFFANIIMELFKDEGLLIIDSGDPEIRYLEKEFFIKQISNFKEITKCVKEQQEMLKNQGFKEMIEISDTAANLFFYDEENQERLLLEFDEVNQMFMSKNGSVSFSLEELLEIANEFPVKLSNNVVTRPLTQEMLFPTLAFIGGPGEIAYWAELKKVFEIFDMKMPPIVPRLNISLIERSVESTIKELNLNLENVLTTGTKEIVENFLNSVSNKNVHELLENTKQHILANFKKIEADLKIDHKGLLPVLNKNELLLMQQIQFMEQKIQQANNLKHEVLINKYVKVENSLRPLSSPQERVWNVIYFLNKYGLSLVSELSKLSYSFDGSHQVVRL